MRRFCCWNHMVHIFTTSLKVLIVLSFDAISSEMQTASLNKSRIYYVKIASYSKATPTTCQIQSVKTCCTISAIRTASTFITYRFLLFVRRSTRTRAFFCFSHKGKQLRNSVRKNNALWQDCLRLPVALAVCLRRIISNLMDFHKTWYSSLQNFEKAWVSWNMMQTQSTFLG